MRPSGNESWMTPLPAKKESRPPAALPLLANKPRLTSDSAWPSSTSSFSCSNFSWAWTCCPGCLPWSARRRLSSPRWSLERWQHRRWRRDQSRRRQGLEVCALEVSSRVNVFRQRHLPTPHTKKKFHAAGNPRPRTPPDVAMNNHSGQIEARSRQSALRGAGPRNASRHLQTDKPGALPSAGSMCSPN